MQIPTLSELVASTSKPIREKLEFHFQLFDQELPSSFIPVCAMAIYLAESECDLNLQLDLPANVAYQGKHKATAARIIEDFKLECFIGHVKPPLETGQFDAL